MVNSGFSVLVRSFKSFSNDNGPTLGSRLRIPPYGTIPGAWVMGPTFKVLGPIFPVWLKIQSKNKVLVIFTLPETNEF